LLLNLLDDIPKIANILVIQVEFLQMLVDEHTYSPVRTLASPSHSARTSGAMCMVVVDDARNLSCMACRVSRMRCSHRCTYKL
jgi:hypothetical protein